MRTLVRTAGWMLGATLLVAGLPAAAEGESSPGPCKGDVEKFCADVPPGTWSLLRCLASHRDQLSTGCRDSLSGERHQRSQQFAKVEKACGGDLQQFCPNRHGPLHVMHCLHQHRAALSPACQAVVPEQPAAAKPDAAAPKPEPAKPAPTPNS
jgi:hypothetical protein